MLESKASKGELCLSNLIPAFYVEVLAADAFASREGHQNFISLGSRADFIKTIFSRQHRQLRDSLLA